MVAYFPEYCFQYGAAQVGRYIAAFDRFFHQRHDVAVGVEGVLDISFGMAVTHVMKTGPENTAFDHFLLHQGFQLQRITCCRCEGDHAAAVVTDAMGIVVHTGFACNTVITVFQQGAFFVEVSRYVFIAQFVYSSDTGRKRQRFAAKGGIAEHFAVEQRHHIGTTGKQGYGHTVGAGFGVYRRSTFHRK